MAQVHINYNVLFLRFGDLLIRLNALHLLHHKGLVFRLRGLQWYTCTSGPKPNSSLYLNMDTILFYLVVSLCIFRISILSEIPYLLSYLKSKSQPKAAALRWEYLRREEVQEVQRMMWDRLEWMLDEQLGNKPRWNFLLLKPVVVMLQSIRSNL